MLLPGRRATVFRSEVIKTWVRVFGGDLTLVDEIIRNNEIQNALPEDHPARSFGDAIHELRRDNDGEVSSLTTTVSKAISAEMETRFEQFQKYMELQRRGDRETLMKAIETVNNSIAASANRMDLFMVDQQNPGVDLHCQYRHLVRGIDSVSVEGASDYNFRAEFNGFCITLSNVFFHTLGQKTSIAAADFIKDVLNVNVVFARPINRWSSLCTRTLLQACAVLRIRQWACNERGLQYPNNTVTKEIQHSTFLNLRSYFSLISHIDRVWEERVYDGCVVLGNMISALLSKFGADLAVYDVDVQIEYRYGARKAMAPPAHTQPEETQSAAVPTPAGVNNSATDRLPFVRFLYHFFALQHTRRYISVAGLMQSQRSFAAANNLPEITTRQSILKNVNDHSLRLNPVKTGNRIVGWSWR